MVSNRTIPTYVSYEYQYRSECESDERSPSTRNLYGSSRAINAGKQRRRDTQNKKKKHADQLDRKLELEESATKIQTIFRGNIVRSAFESPSLEEEKETMQMCSIGAVRQRRTTIAQQTNVVSRYHKKAVLQVRQREL